jgi:phosphatidylethanolamine/phosphatidyl-N-methylethanolamine N-methyltransferase
MVSGRASLRKAAAGQEGSALAVIDGSHILAVYGRWAPFYDYSFGLFTRAPSRAAVAEMNKLPPGRVLEVGVGTGISLPLYDGKHRLVGIDFSPDMLALARKKVAAEGLDNVDSLHEMDAANLRFPDQGFDAAMAMFVITVVPDPDRVLSELIRVVRPGGRVVLVNHFSADRGPRAVIEGWLSRFSARLGWRPDFPIARVLGRPELRLIERRRVRAFDLFTLLVFERL